MEDEKVIKHNIETKIELMNQKKALSEQDKLIASNLWSYLVKGHPKKMILKELNINAGEYDRLIDLGLKILPPTAGEIDLQRQLAVERHLKIYQELETIVETSDKPNDKLYALKELRQSVKEVSDIYGVKIPQQINVEVTDNSQSNATANALIELLATKQQQPAIEAEVIEDEQ